MRAFFFRVGEGYLSHILYGGSSEARFVIRNMRQITRATRKKKASISSEMQILLFDPAGEKEGVLKC